MAKGNDGNFLQHCIEVEAALHLRERDPEGRLHIVLTHGMAPREKLNRTNANKELLYSALEEATCGRRLLERNIVHAYRKSWRRHPPVKASLRNEMMSHPYYPNSAELLRSIIGTEKLSGGITEVDADKCEGLSGAWAGSKVKVRNTSTSWRGELRKGILCCPDDLDTPWLFSMDPMSYCEEGGRDDAYLHRSDLELIRSALERYIVQWSARYCMSVRLQHGSQRPSILEIHV